MDFDTLKFWFDVGAGAWALVLWIRQSKTNKMLQSIDDQQRQMLNDLTGIVKDHEARLKRLETKRETRKERRRKR